MSLLSEIHEYTVFARETIRNGNVCAPTPMTWMFAHYLSRKYVRGPCKKILEMGCGTNRIARSLTQHGPQKNGKIGTLPVDGTYTSIELNPNLVQFAHENNFDPRVRIVEGDAVHAERILNGERVDLVFTSIPISQLPDRGTAILQAAKNVLAPGGKIVVTIYRNVTLTLKKIFDVVPPAKTKFINFPPMCVQEGWVLREKIPTKISLNGKAHGSAPLYY